MALQAVQEACLLGSVMSGSIKEQREPNWLFRNYLCQPYLEIWAHQPCSSFVCGVFGGCMRSKVIKARCCVVDTQQIDLDALIPCIAKSISANWQPRSSSLTGHICVYGVTLSWWQLGSIPPLCSVSSTGWSNCVLSALSLPSLCSHWVVGLVWLPHLEAVNVAVVASSTGATCIPHNASSAVRQLSEQVNCNHCWYVGVTYVTLSSLLDIHLQLFVFNWHFCGWRRVTLPLATEGICRILWLFEVRKEGREGEGRTRSDWCELYEEGRVRAE